MHFYIDESGHTGPNLFDPNQRMLYYGVLSSPVNVDVLAEERLKNLRARARVARLHANELGNGGLVPIAADLARIQERLNLRFDLYRVAKPDHAVISFFDQVFDQGLNPAITWTGYWTPLRYVLLLRLAMLFDEGLARMAWDARIEADDKKCHAVVAEVCHELVGRVHKLPDARSRELIGDTLSWAAKNPAELSYNAKSKSDRLSVMPNIIGFQAVMLGIAERLNKSDRRASRIVVDQQSQFNGAQKTLAGFYASVRSIQLATGPGLPEMSLKGVPDIPIEISGGMKSCGLELVDVYLWAFRRIMEDKELAPELYGFIAPQLRRGRTNEISLKAIANRWEKWFATLPEPTEDQIIKGREIFKADEARRLTAIGR
jgi:hypothetical protein